MIDRRHGPWDVPLGAANEDIVYQIPPKRARGNPKVFRTSRITRNPGSVRARIRS